GTAGADGRLGHRLAVGHARRTIVLADRHRDRDGGFLAEDWPTGRHHVTRPGAARLADRKSGVYGKRIDRRRTVARRLKPAGVGERRQRYGSGCGAFGRASQRGTAGTDGWLGHCLAVGHARRTIVLADRHRDRDGGFLAEDWPTGRHHVTRPGAARL